MVGCFFGKPPFNPFGAEFAVFVFFHIVVLFPSSAYPFPSGRTLEASVWEQGPFFPSFFFFFFYFFFSNLQRKEKKRSLFSFAWVTVPFPTVGGKDYVMCSRYFVNGAQPCDSPSLDRRGRQGKEKENKKKIKTTTQ